jgi:hypothetical protein
VTPALLPEPHDHLLLMGDFFDDLRTGITDAADTARQVKRSLDSPNWWANTRALGMKVCARMINGLLEPMTLGLAMWAGGRLVYSTLSILAISPQGR